MRLTFDICGMEAWKCRIRAHGPLLLTAPTVYQPARLQGGVASSTDRGQASAKQRESKHDERVALGCDVEVVPGAGSRGVQQGAPSLEDVLRAIRSGTEGEFGYNCQPLTLACTMHCIYM